MSERAAFISAILDNLDDDTPRLVFADWLQENGEEERAEFIRCQIEAARLPEVERRKSKPGVRALALEAIYAPAWRQRVGLHEQEGYFERGFLTGVSAFIDQMPTLVGQLLTAEPISFTLRLRGEHSHGEPIAPEEIERLAANSLLRAVTNVVSQGGAFGSERFSRLMRSAYLGNLRVIEFFDDPIGLEGVKAIIESPSAFVLESLDLNESLQGYGGAETDDTFEAVKLIASSPRFASLKHLGLMFNGLNDRSVAALLESETLSRTLWLDIEDNEYDEERFAEALAERFVGGSYEG